MFGVPLKNLALFAMVNIVAMAIVMVILFWLDTQFGFDGGSSASWIPPFAAACIVAGNSYAKASGWTWTREDRRNLAMAYAAVSFLISLVIAFGYIALDATALELLGAFWGLFILFFGLLFGTLISYAFARLLLGRVVRQSSQNNDHPSNVRN